jgi:hypothetical protein
VDAVEAFGRPEVVGTPPVGTVVLQRRRTDGGLMIHLVSKELHHQKPTAMALRATLRSAAAALVAAGCTHVVMPRIGCGLDQLHWSKRVRRMIMTELCVYHNITVEVRVPETEWYTGPAPTADTPPSELITPALTPTSPSLHVSLSVPWSSDAIDTMRTQLNAAVTAPWPSFGEVYVDVRRVGAPMASIVAAMADMNFPPAHINLVCNWESLVRHRPTPPPPHTLVRIPKGAQMSLRTCDGECLTCDWHDEMYSAAGLRADTADVAPSEQLMAFGRALHASGRWEQHQSPKVAPIDDDCEPVAGPPSVPYEALEFFLKWSASAPKPDSLLRGPRPAGIPHEGGSRRMRIPWSSNLRPTSKRVSSTDRDRPHLWIAILLAVASGWMTQVETSFVRSAGLMFIVDQLNKKRACFAHQDVNALTSECSVWYASPGDALRPAGSRAKGDVKSAFMLMHLADCDAPYVCLLVDGIALAIRVVWFGLAAGPRYFSARMHTALAPMTPRSRSPTSTWVGRGCLVLIYIDDVCVGAVSHDDTTFLLLSVTTWLWEAGLWPAVAKTFGQPCLRLKFLGLVVDPLRLRLLVAASSAVKALATLTQFSDASRQGTSLDDNAYELLGSFLGKMSFFSRALPILRTIRVALSRVFNAGDDWSERADAEVEQLIDILPHAHTLSQACTPGWPILFTCFDGSCASEGGALWYLIDRGGRLIHSARTVFDLDELDIDLFDRTPSACFECSTITASVLAARKYTDRIGWVIAMGDPASVVAAISAGKPGLRANDGLPPVRFRTTSTRFAACLKALAMALFNKEQREFAYITAAWHRRSELMAKAADGLSDGLGGVGCLTRPARSLLWALLGTPDIDLAARSDVTATSTAWLMVGSGDDGRQSLLPALTAMGAGSSAPLWPRVPSDATLAGLRLAWLLLISSPMKAWMEWVRAEWQMAADTLVIAIADVDVDRIRTFVRAVAPPGVASRWGFDIPLSGHPVRLSGGSAPTEMGEHTSLAVRCYASQAAWNAFTPTAPETEPPIANAPRWSSYSLPRWTLHPSTLTLRTRADGPRHGANGHRPAETAWTLGGPKEGDGPFTIEQVTAALALGEDSLRNHVNASRLQAARLIVVNALVALEPPVPPTPTRPTQRRVKTAPRQTYARRNKRPRPTAADALASDTEDDANDAVLDRRLGRLLDKDAGPDTPPQAEGFRKDPNEDSSDSETDAEEPKGHTAPTSTATSSTPALAHTVSAPARPTRPEWLSNSAAAARQALEAERVRANRRAARSTPRPDLVTAAAQTIPAVPTPSPSHRAYTQALPSLRRRACARSPLRGHRVWPRSPASPHVTTTLTTHATPLAHATPTSTLPSHCTPWVWSRTATASAPTFDVSSPPEDDDDRASTGSWHTDTGCPAPPSPSPSAPSSTDSEHASSEEDVTSPDDSDLNTPTLTRTHSAIPRRLAGALPARYARGGRGGRRGGRGGAGGRGHTTDQAPIEAGGLAQAQTTADPESLEVVDMAGEDESNADAGSPPAPPHTVPSAPADTQADTQEVPAGRRIIRFRRRATTAPTNSNPTDTAPKPTHTPSQPLPHSNPSTPPTHTAHTPSPIQCAQSGQRGTPPPSPPPSPSSAPRSTNFGTEAEEDLARTGHPPGDGPQVRTLTGPVTHPAVGVAQPRPTVDSSLAQRRLLSSLGHILSPPHRIQSLLPPPSTPTEPTFTIPPATLPPMPPIAQRTFLQGAHPPMPCAACGKIIGSLEPARLCDEAECNRWLVCRDCAPHRLDWVTLLCVKHQLGLGLVRPCAGMDDPVTALATSSPGSIGRLCLRLVALATGSSAALLAPWPFTCRSTGSRLHTEALLAVAGHWNDTRRAAVAGPAKRLLSLVHALESMDEPAEPDGLQDLAAAYVRRRLDAPLQGWKPCNGATVAGDLSALAAAARIDAIPSTPSYCGPVPRAVLANRGAFERKDHSHSLPVTVRMLLLMRQRITPEEVPTWQQGVLQGLSAARPGIIPRLTLKMLRRVGPGWLFFWDRRIKTKRGDKTKSDAPGIIAPQLGILAGPLAEEILLPAIAAAKSPDSLLFPHASTDKLNRLLQKYINAPPGTTFVVRAHALRNGADTVLQCLRLPKDVIDAWAWWARERKSAAYYASINLEVMFAAAALMHLVIIAPVAPGFCRFVGMADGATIPDWSRITPSLPPGAWDTLEDALAGAKMCDEDAEDSDDDHRQLVALEGVSKRRLAVLTGTARTRAFSD